MAAADTGFSDHYLRFSNRHHSGSKGRVEEREIHSGAGDVQHRVRADDGQLYPGRIDGDAGLLTGLRLFKKGGGKRGAATLPFIIELRPKTIVQRRLLILQ